MSMIVIFAAKLLLLASGTIFFVASVMEGQKKEPKVRQLAISMVLGAVMLLVGGFL